MADPRVFRGSVVAAKRDELNRCRKEIEARKAEERYRMEVVRNRLSMALANEQPNPIIYKRAENIRAATSARLAKLAGKTGRTAIGEWVETQNEKGIDRHSPRKIPRRLSPLGNAKMGSSKPMVPIEAPKINGFHRRTIASIPTTRGNANLKNVRFIPLKNESPRNGPRKLFVDGCCEIGWLTCPSFFENPPLKSHPFLVTTITIF